MTISASCPSCFREYRLKDSLAGKKVRCKECGAVVSIPRSASARSQPPADPGATDEAFDDDPYVDDAPPPRRERGGTVTRKQRKSRPASRWGLSVGVIITILAAVCGLMFLLACVIGFFFPPAMALLIIVIYVVGFVVYNVGLIGQIVVAFREDVICGILYLFMPFYGLYYLITRFGNMWKWLLVRAGGVSLVVGGLLLNVWFARTDQIRGDLFPIREVDLLPNFGSDGHRGEIANAQEASRQNLQMMGMGMTMCYLDEGRFPPGPGRDGQFQVSWQTSLFPYLNSPNSDYLYLQINRRAAWDDPVNRQATATVVDEFLQPGVSEERDARGFALSHYAMNRELIGDSGGLAYQDIGDGNTIAAGEVGGGYKPWADPSNVRDLTGGLVPGPATFGNPTGEGAFMLFIDGSVRWFSSETDPGVLQALGTPNGGEDVADF